MVRANKTARISTGGYHPPRYQYEPMEPQEESSPEHEETPPPSDQASEPELSQVESEPEEEPQEFILISDDEEEGAPGGGQPPSPPQDGPAEDDESPPIGWTRKVYHKASCNAPSHHRLVGMLENYFSDWDGVVEYSCIEYTHPLENTYWKSKVLIFPKDVEKDAYLKDRGYRHDGHRATMEESMEEAAFTACLFLREQRFGNMRWDIHRYLPRLDPEQGWGMLEPTDLDPVSRVMVYFAHEMVEKHLKLQDMVIAQGKALKRCYKMIDDHREREGQPKIYGKLDYEPRP